MFKWFTERAKRKAQEQFDRGFDYAAGQLLRGVDTDTLEDQTCLAVDFGDGDEFEDGMTAALVKWEERRVTVLRYPALTC